MYFTINNEKIDCNIYDFEIKVIRMKVTRTQLKTMLAIL